MFNIDYFSIKELVPIECYNKLSYNPKLMWQQFDPRALQFLVWLRQRYGSIIVNDWAFKGNSQWRGLRLPSSPFWSDYSQHSRGRAFDCIMQKISAEEVRTDLIKVFDKQAPIDYITLEDGVNWLHFDVRFQERPVTLFKP